MTSRIKQAAVVGAAVVAAGLGGTAISQAASNDGTAATDTTAPAWTQVQERERQAPAPDREDCPKENGGGSGSSSSSTATSAF